MACRDCGHHHPTFIDGVRCDLTHHTPDIVRAQLAAIGLTPVAVDALIAQADKENPHGR